MHSTVYTYTCPACDATVGTDVANVEALCHCPSRRRAGRRQTTAVMRLTHVNVRRREALASV